MSNGLSVHRVDERASRACAWRPLSGRARCNAGRSPAHEVKRVDMGQDRKGRRRKVPARVKAARLKERLDRILGYKPNPVQADEAGPDSVPCRFFDCPGYEDCMHVACVGNWCGFTCSHCGLYQRWFDDFTRAAAKQRINEQAAQRSGLGQIEPESISSRARPARGTAAGRRRPQAAQALEAGAAEGTDRVQGVEANALQADQRRKLARVQRSDPDLVVCCAGEAESVLLRDHDQRVRSSEEGGERGRRGKVGPTRVRRGGRRGARGRTDPSRASERKGRGKRR